MHQQFTTATFFDKPLCFFAEILQVRLTFPNMNLFAFMKQASFSFQGKYYSCQLLTVPKHRREIKLKQMIILFLPSEYKRWYAVHVNKLKKKDTG